MSTGTQRICELQQRVHSLTHERESTVETSSALNTKTCSRSHLQNKPIFLSVSGDTDTEQMTAGSRVHVHIENL